MANEVANRGSNSGVPAIVEDLRGNREQFATLLPAGVSVEVFERTMLNAFIREPDLAKCSKRSLFDACSKAARDGLVLDGREAALVVHKRNKQIDGKWETVGYDATYIPMVLGIRKKLYETGLIAKLETGIVYTAEIEKDLFEFIQGTEGYVKHRPMLIGDRGPPAAAYSIVTFKTGETSVEVMRWDEIMAIAKRVGRGKLGNVWQSDTTEMARKTVLRRHAKSLPMAAEHREFMQGMDEADASAQAQAGEEDQTQTQPRAGTAAERLRKHRAAAAAAPETIDPPHDEDGVIDHDPQDHTSPADADYQDVM